MEDQCRGHLNIYDRGKSQLFGERVQLCYFSTALS